MQVSFTTQATLTPPHGRHLQLVVVTCHQHHAPNTTISSHDPPTWVCLHHSLIHFLHCFLYSPDRTKTETTKGKKVRVLFVWKENSTRIRQVSSGKVHLILEVTWYSWKSQWEKRTPFSPLSLSLVTHSLALTHSVLYRLPQTQLTPSFVPPPSVRLFQSSSFFPPHPQSQSPSFSLPFAPSGLNCGCSFFRYSLRHSLRHSLHHSSHYCVSFPPPKAFLVTLLNYLHIFYSS